MLFWIRTTCQRQEKVGICRNTYREPFLCYWNADDTAQPHPWSSSCDWSITEQRYSSDFATPSKTVIEIPSCFTHVFGNQWVTSLWKLRHLGKLVFGYVTVKLVIYQKTEILLSVLTICQEHFISPKWKFGQNSGKEYMPLGTTEARPTQKETPWNNRDMERTECLYGILSYTVIPALPRLQTTFSMSYALSQHPTLFW